MAEPASSTTLAVTAGLGVAALMPFIDGNALLGATLGAALIASTKRDLRWWQRLLSLLISVGAGYVLASEVINQTPIRSTAAAAFFASVCAVPIALRLSVMAEQLDIASVLGVFSTRGRRNRDDDLGGGQ